MIIKLLKVKDIEKKGYPFKQIVGQQADGETYTKDIIVGRDTENLLNTLDQFGAGDLIELSYAGKYKNVSEIKEAKSFPEQKKYTPNKGGSMNVQRSDGTTRGDDTNRASAIYLAKDVMLAVHTDKDLKTRGINEFLIEMMTTAEAIKEYIKTGNRPITSDTPEDDGLEPPEID